MVVLQYRNQVFVAELSVLSIERSLQFEQVETINGSDYSHQSHELASSLGIRFDLEQKENRIEQIDVLVIDEHDQTALLLSTLKIGWCWSNI